MTTEAEYKQKFTIAMSALVVTLVVTVGTWIWSVTRAAKSDREGFAAQQQFGGMPDPAQMQKQMLDRMTQELGLTAAQKTQVAKLEEELWTERERNRPQGNGDWEQSRLRMEKVHQKHDAQMAKILSAEQLVKYKTLQQQRPGMGGPGGPGMGGPGMGGPPMMGGPGGMMPPPGGMPPGGGPPEGRSPGGRMPASGSRQGGIFPGGMPPGGGMPPNGPGGGMPPPGGPNRN